MDPVMVAGAPLAHCLLHSALESLWPGCLASHVGAEMRSVLLQVLYAPGNAGEWLARLLPVRVLSKASTRVLHARRCHCS